MIDGIEEVTSWSTTDGKFFSDLKDAEAHQVELKLGSLFEVDPILVTPLPSSIDSVVDLEDLKDWLKRNSALVIEYCEQHSEKETYINDIKDVDIKNSDEFERKLNPRFWTKEESAAWHRAIPDTQKAFDDLRQIERLNEG